MARRKGCVRQVVAAKVECFPKHVWKGTAGISKTRSQIQAHAEASNSTWPNNSPGAGHSTGAPSAPATKAGACDTY
eukprot:11174377-Lingulodinium_polyedra.AAC.1